MQSNNVAFCQRPPMGWNSWDCFGASVTEEEVRQNARYMAQHLKAFGWEYVVVDIQWYEPTADGSVYHPFANLAMDEFGRLIPAENRFLSSKGGKGFAPLADYVHELGLKFGIHIMRGIPRQAVHQNTPVLGTDVRARDIAHPYSICPWNTDMYGIAQGKPGAQAYYRSIVELYASWGVDFLKVDDISYTDFGKDPYAGRGEIEMLRRAIDECGRDMVLSLSCGPAPIEQATHLQANANMWRLTADLWDRWEDIEPMFEKCAQWQPFAVQGHWPDADMLPLGHLSVRGSEHGVMERICRLTQAEQCSMMTLWCIARSPLMMGGTLTDLSPETQKLLTNPHALAMNQGNQKACQVMRCGYNDACVLWRSQGDADYIAVFNTWNVDARFELDLGKLGLSKSTVLLDVWNDVIETTHGDIFPMTLPIHGCRLFKVVNP